MRVFAKGSTAADPTGGVTLWAADELCDGSAAVPFFRAPDAVFALDDCAWLVTSYLPRGGVGAFGMAPVPQPGALASVLSTLVES